MSRFLYYIFLKPISYLPLWALYPISDFLYILLVTIVPYRRQVVRTNLQKSFPNKNKKELRKIEKGFYKFLADLMVESIWNFSITEKEARERLVVKNPEILTPYYNNDKDVIIVVGHYNSWEFLLTALNVIIPHRGAVIYTSLTDKFLDKVFKNFREKFGMKLITKTEVKHVFKNRLDQPMAILFGSDQAPASASRAYWTNFLHQDTAVAIGVEKYAIKYNLPVFFGGLNRIKRGYYSLELKLLTDTPLSSKEGEISEMHVRAMEQLIIKEPRFWLWSHKRWKRVRGAW